MFTTFVELPILSVRRACVLVNISVVERLLTLWNRLHSASANSQWISEQDRPCHSAMDSSVLYHLMYQFTGVSSVRTNCHVHCYFPCAGLNTELEAD